MRLRAFEIDEPLPELNEPHALAILKPWVDVENFPLIPSELNKAIVEAFRSKAISIPFPQREVRMLGRVA